jgi:NitT/TauT family transport system ATP-binding protein
MKPDSVEIQNLSVEFAAGSGVFAALSEVTLSIAPGEFVCILGPSGCGKSTLLNVIAGFETPTSGVVTVGGQPVHGPSPDRIFVFQESAVFPWMTARQNVAFASKKQDPLPFLEMVGLKGFEDAWPHQLSGGMRQRLEIARALAADPRMLFMDEPFSALDYFTKLRLRRDLLRIWREKAMTILFVTHDVEEAVQLADRVVVMATSPGRVQEIVDVKLPRPRDLDAPEYLATRDHLLEVLGL